VQCIPAASVPAGCGTSFGDGRGCGFIGTAAVIALGGNFAGKWQEEYEKLGTSAGFYDDIRKETIRLTSDAG